MLPLDVVRLRGLEGKSWNKTFDPDVVSFKTGFCHDLTLTQPAFVSSHHRLLFHIGTAKLTDGNALAVCVEVRKWQDNDQQEPVDQEFLFFTDVKRDAEFCRDYLGHFAGNWRLDVDLLVSTIQAILAEPHD